MPLKDKLLALAVVVAWALNIVVVKLGIAEIPPIFLSALRFALVAALIIPFTRITLRQLPWVVLVSITFGGMHFGLLFVALSRIGGRAPRRSWCSSARRSRTVLACLLFREPFGLVRLLGLALAVLGIGVLAAGPTLPGPLPLALLLAERHRLGGDQPHHQVDAGHLAADRDRLVLAHRRAAIAGGLGLLRARPVGVARHRDLARLAVDRLQRGDLLDRRLWHLVLAAAQALDQQRGARIRC